MISAAMRHPLLRALIAVTLGLWSTICCCQAQAIVGQACHAGPPAEAPSCCSGCHDEPESTDDEGGERGGGDGRDERREHSPGCPSCQNQQATAGSRFDHGPHDREHAQPALPVLAFAAEPRAIAAPVDSLRPRGLSTAAANPRANRVTLRWHCALVV